MFERELVKSVSGREVNMFEIGKRLFNGYNPIRILRDDLGRRLADEDCIHEHARDEGVCMEVVEIAIIEQMLKLAPYCEQEVERRLQK